MVKGMFEHERLVAVAAVAQAARLCQSVAAGMSPEVLAKRDRSPVTVADFGAQALVCRMLAQAFPDDAIIAEEDSGELREPGNASILDEVVRQVGKILGGPNGTKVAPGSGCADHVDAATVCGWIDRGGASEYRSRFWTVDPIDGTKGFLRGEQYAVALALVVEGRMVVAALACPNLPERLERNRRAGSETAGVKGSGGTLLYAVRGEGAFAVQFDAASGAILAPAGAIGVSVVDEPACCCFCESVESGHSAHGDAESIAQRLGIVTPGMRIDSQAKYAVVGRGDADVYLRLPTSASYREKIWDHAAGTLIVTEAGGTVTDIAGKPLEFQHGRELAANRGVVVTNGRLHGAVLDAVQSVLGGGI